MVKVKGAYVKRSVSVSAKAFARPSRGGMGWVRPPEAVDNPGPSRRPGQFNAAGAILRRVPAR